MGKNRPIISHLYKLYFFSVVFFIVTFLISLLVVFHFFACISFLPSFACLFPYLFVNM
jgi:hypothetical protein